MEAADWTSILPPLLAIGLALVTRQVILSLGSGIWLGYWLLDQDDPLSAVARSIDGIIGVLGDAGNARVILFALVVGALITIIEHLGGILGLVSRLERQRWVKNARKSQWLAWWTGILIFIESNLTLMIAGAVSRPLFDRFRISRERLAYIIDSTAAPVCIMIPLNAWGAFNIGLLANTALDNPLAVFVASLPLNFYAILAIAMAALSIACNWNPGAMRRAEQRAREEPPQTLGTSPDDPAFETRTDPEKAESGHEWFMIIPLATMIAMVFIGLFITGDGRFSQGSGSTSVLWGVLSGLAVAWIMALATKRMSVDRLMTLSLQGAGRLLPIAAILMMSLALGDVADHLGTGAFMAQMLGANVPAVLLPALIFLAAAAISFSIGSSWGTFAIMIPIAIPVAMGLDISPALFLGAVLAGSIFGDHCSPISDTTIIASLAAQTDHIEHVRTQLPYALIAGGLAAACYLVAGLLA